MLHLGTRMESENLFAGSISELSSPFAAAAHQLWPLVAFKLLLALTLVAALARIRRPRPFELGLVIVFSALAALAVRNVRLTESLTAHVAEIGASRARLVRAQESERRRIERNIHDGVQQELASLGAAVSDTWFLPQFGHDQQ